MPRGASCCECPCIRWPSNCCAPSVRWRFPAPTCRAGSAALTAAEARGQLDDKVAVYLDGGQAELGAASTIVDLTGPAPVIVREGPISREQIVEVIGGQVGPVESGESGEPTES